MSGYAEFMVTVRRLLEIADEILTAEEQPRPQLGLFDPAPAASRELDPLLRFVFEHAAAVRRDVADDAEERYAIDYALGQARAIARDYAPLVPAPAPPPPEHATYLRPLLEALEARAA